MLSQMTRVMVQRSLILLEKEIVRSVHLTLRCPVAIMRVPMSEPGREVLTLEETMILFRALLRLILAEPRKTEPTPMLCWNMVAG